MAKIKNLALGLAIMLIIASILPMITLTQSQTMEPMSADQAVMIPPLSGKVKNIILIIGDGMGIEEITLARLVYGSLNMARFPYTGYVLTYSLSGEVTDSAAAATEIATGVMTFNGMIGMTSINGNNFKVTTILEIAEMMGKSTGLISTTRITHATPASFAAHVPDRGMETEIAQQLIMNDVDVLFGGGASRFSEELLAMAREKGYQVIFTKEELYSVRGGKVLGLFARSHLPYVIDRDESIPSLPEMTRVALSILEKNPNGFFLMVEAGRIDHAGHTNDPTSVAAETKELDDVVGVALEYAMERGDTLVVVTADHETGGLSIGVTYGRSINFELLKSVRKSLESMAREISEGADVAEVVSKYSDIELTQEDVEWFNQRVQELLPSRFAVSNALGELISRKLGVGFTTHAHTGVMIPVMAFGPGAEMFTGIMHHVDVGKRLAIAMIFGGEISTQTMVFAPKDLKGDLDGDSEVTILDAYLTLTLFVGEFVDTRLETLIDMDGNGIIDYMDVVLILSEATK